MASNPLNIYATSESDQYPEGTVVDLHYFNGDHPSTITVRVHAWGLRGLMAYDYMERLQWFPYTSIQRLIPQA